MSAGGVRAADRVAGAALLALGVGCSVGALRSYAYWGDSGPGPAFLPFWVGVVMALLAALLLVGSVRSRDPGAGWLPRGDGLRRLGAVLAATVALVALLDRIGMVVGTVLFLAVLIRVLDGSRWLRAIAVAAAVAGVNHLIFVRWLKLPMPVGVFGF